MTLKDVDKLRKFVHKIIEELENTDLTYADNTSWLKKDDEVKNKIQKRSEELKEEFEELLK